MKKVVLLLLTSTMVVVAEKRVESPVDQLAIVRGELQKVRQSLEELQKEQASQSLSNKAAHEDTAEGLRTQVGLEMVHVHLLMSSLAWLIHGRVPTTVSERIRYFTASVAVMVTARAVYMLWKLRRCLSF